MPIRKGRGPGGRRAPGALRTAILDATSRLLLRTGDPAHVAIADVVRAVRCTPPALYHYFPTKQELLQRTCEREYERFAAAIETRLPPDADPLAELAARGTAYLHWARAHPAHYRVLFMTPLDLAVEAPDTAPRDAAGLGALVANVERARRAGLLASVDPVRGALHLWAAAHGVASLAITNPAIPAAILDAALADLTAAFVALHRVPAAAMRRGAATRGAATRGAATRRPAR
jgi:AcrR family transcriptional regulator